MRKILAAALLSTVGLFGVSGAALAHQNGPQVSFGFVVTDGYRGYAPPRAYYPPPPRVYYNPYATYYNPHDDWRREHWRHERHERREWREHHRGRGHDWDR